jgi:hypothetical protein
MKENKPSPWRAIRPLIRMAPRPDSRTGKSCHPAGAPGQLAPSAGNGVGCSGWLLLVLQMFGRLVRNLHFPSHLHRRIFGARLCPLGYPDPRKLGRRSAVQSIGRLVGRFRTADAANKSLRESDLRIVSDGLTVRTVNSGKFLAGQFLSPAACRQGDARRTSALIGTRREILFLAEVLEKAGPKRVGLIARGLGGPRYPHAFSVSRGRSVASIPLYHRRPGAVSGYDRWIPIRDVAYFFLSVCTYSTTSISSSAVIVV